MTPDEIQRHKFHVDEMYTDFKQRVCDGRGINPEVVDLIAGGRVMTGLKAFSLNAPEALIRQIKGLDAPGIPQQDRVVELTDAEPPVIATSPLEDGEREAPTATVAISEDQDMSPFAPPEPAASPLPSVIEPVELPETAEANAQAALASSTPEDLVAPTIPPASISGVFPVVLGPFGRGLIDGIGGIRDSAVYATELFVSIIPAACIH